MSTQPDSINPIANIKHDRVGDLLEATVTVKLQLRADGNPPLLFNGADAFEAIITTVKLQWNGKKGPQSADVFEETTIVKPQRKDESGSQCDDAFENITTAKSQSRGESGPISDDESEDAVKPRPKGESGPSCEDESEDAVKPRRKVESGPSGEDEFENTTTAERKQKGKSGPSSEEDEFGDSTTLKPQRKDESGPQSDDELERITTAKPQRKGKSGSLSDDESEDAVKPRRKGESGPSCEDEFGDATTLKPQRKGESGPQSDDEFGDMTDKPHRKGESGPLSDDEFGDKIVKPHRKGESGPLSDDDEFEEIIEAAESENVWEHFLPSIYHDTIGLDPSLKFSTKKQLFSFLCEKPIFIDNGKKSFFLDKLSGLKCCILGARDLLISWGEDRRYWEWISLPESRFSEVARLKNVWWFEIRGTIRTCLLSSSTKYSAYLIFKMIGDTVLGLDIGPARVSIGVKGGSNQITCVCLDPYCGLHNFERWRTQVSPDMLGLKRPKKRNDGWYEAKLGEFFNEKSDHNINNDELEISCRETNGRVFKSDIIIEGIEIRPTILDVENNDVIRKPTA